MTSLIVAMTIKPRSGNGELRSDYDEHRKLLGSLVVAVTSLVVVMTNLVVTKTSLVAVMTNLVVTTTSLVEVVKNLVVTTTSLVVVMTSLVVTTTSLVAVVTSLVAEMAPKVIKKLFYFYNAPVPVLQKTSSKHSTASHIRLNT